MRMRTLVFGLLIVMPLLAVGQSAASEPMPALNHFDPKQVDPGINPCDDFFQYTCSKWQQANPIPPDQAAWSAASPLRLWNELVLRDTLEKSASNIAKTRSPIEQKIGDYYAACMDEKGIEANAKAELQPELDAITKIKDMNGLVDGVARLHKMFPGVTEGTTSDDNQTAAAFFGMAGGQDLDDASKVVALVDQGGLALPNRDFYLNQDDRSKNIRGKYEQHVQRMFVLAGESELQAKADADTVLNIETDLAKAQMDNVQRRDPANINNKMSLAQLQALTPSFDWNRYFKDVGGMPATPHYLVSSPEFFKGLQTALKEHPLEHWKTYMRWHLLHGAATYLSDAFVQENFDFYGRTLFGTKQLTPRWRRCVRWADRDLGEALGQAYVDRAFPPASKQRMDELVSAIEAALNKDIQEINWMKPETKKMAAVKLKAIEEKIGYPKKWRDYSSVKIGPNNLLGNVGQAAAFEYRRSLNKIGKPVDRGEWSMTPPTINAYYDPQLNTINFPAGILQPPFFDANQDDAVNYGAIGMVIGHEITHGFDDQGRKFDAQGNLKDWWTQSDAAEYDKRGNCIVEEYTVVIPEAQDAKQNGHLTQGEDTADNGGLRIALMALQYTLDKKNGKLDEKGADGWTPRQRFFLAYANSWCSQIRPEVARVQVMTNPHSLGKYRVNNVVSNMPEFQQAFSCKPGQKMVRENACRVW